MILFFLIVTSQNSTILIIDDDAEIRYSLDRVLAPDGHTILTADSGEEGVEVAEKQNPTSFSWITGWEEFQVLKRSSI